MSCGVHQRHTVLAAFFLGSVSCSLAPKTAIPARPLVACCSGNVAIIKEACHPATATAAATVRRGPQAELGGQGARTIPAAVAAPSARVARVGTVARARRAGAVATAARVARAPAAARARARAGEGGHRRHELGRVRGDGAHGTARPARSTSRTSSRSMAKRRRARGASARRARARSIRAETSQEAATARRSRRASATRRRRRTIRSTVPTKRAEPPTRRRL